MSDENTKATETPDSAASALSARLGRITKADIARLEKILASLKHGEACLEKQYGPPTPRSLRAANIKDCQLFERVLLALRPNAKVQADSRGFMREVAPGT